jgi:catechol 2,3-dioxygenase-like lactoylglutathione lyase family enzyme
MAKLHRVVLPVTHIDRVAATYAELLESDGERISPGMHYFDCGPILALYDQIADGVGWPYERGGEGEFVQVSISVPELDWVYWRAQELGFARLTALGRDPIYGERSCCLRDPCGNLVQFIEESTAFRGDGRVRPASG